MDRLVCGDGAMARQEVASAGYIELLWTGNVAGIGATTVLNSIINPSRTDLVIILP